MVAILCPQCGGTLPKQATWRVVACPFCGSLVTRSSLVVRADTFARVHRELREQLSVGTGAVQIQGVVYRKLSPIGSGDTTDVFLGERVSCVPERVVIKIARDEGQPTSMQSEIAALAALQISETPDAAYYSQRVPQVVQHGMTERMQGHTRFAIVLRDTTGYWGSLEKVSGTNSGGMDARHIAWIWRRVLDCLGFVHSAGWTHGDLRPEHLLVQPRDHGIMLCGWGRARRCDPKTQLLRFGTDIVQSAWAMRELMAVDGNDAALSASLPSPMRDLLGKASEDAAWCAREGAREIERQWKAAVLAGFGPPRFVPFEV